MFVSVFPFFPLSPDGYTRLIRSNVLVKDLSLHFCIPETNFIINMWGAPIIPNSILNLILKLLRSFSILSSGNFVLMHAKSILFSNIHIYKEASYCFHDTLKTGSFKMYLHIETRSKVCIVESFSLKNKTKQTKKCCRLSIEHFLDFYRLFHAEIMPICMDSHSLKLATDAVLGST